MDADKEIFFKKREFNSRKILKYISRAPTELLTHDII